MSCKSKKRIIKGVPDLFGEVQKDRIEEKQCKGCENKTAKNHNGIYVKTMNWKEDKIIRFVDIIS